MLNDKVVVVTGGAGALGRSFVDAIARQGGTAIVADVNIEAARRVADEWLAQPGWGSIVAAELDITIKGSVCALIGSLQNRFGRIDAVVNNAYPRNKNYGRRLEDVAYEDFVKT